MRLRDLLTEEELREVRDALDALELPLPTGWADALYLHAIKEAKQRFSAERFYSVCDLMNLSAALCKAGLWNERIFGKLRAAGLSYDEVR